MTKARSILKAFLFCLVFTTVFIAFSFVKGFAPAAYERWAHGIVGTAAALLTTVLFLRFDRKRFSDIGLSWEAGTLKRFFFGALAGIGLMGSLAAGVLYFSGVGIAVNQNSNGLHFLLATGFLLPLAFLEELGFRAYPLELLKDRIGFRGAILLTSIFFALYHIVNGWSLASSFLGPAVWGLVFGLAAVYGRGIAAPTGLHYAANLTTSAFGAAGNSVSIWIVSQPVAPPSAQGIDWATLLPSAVLLVVAIAGLELYRRRSAKRLLVAA